VSDPIKYIYSGSASEAKSILPYPSVRANSEISEMVRLRNT